MIYALVPVKELAWAKARLAGFLTPRERRALMLAMLEDVLQALQGCQGLAGTVVLSRDPEALSLAASLGAEGLLEPPGLAGESAAVTYGAQLLARRGVETLLVLPADVPGVQPEEMERLLAEPLASPGAVLVPAKDGGSNALLLRPPTALAFHFGPGSLRRHLREARARGVAARVLELPSLALDLDEPSDLLELLSLPGATATRRVCRGFAFFRQDTLVPGRLGDPAPSP